MIPILAGIAAVGPIANMFSNITQTIAPPNPAEFNQSLQSATALKPEQVQLDAILKGRAPAELSPLEQQQLATLLVGKTVQMIGTEGQAIQGLISQSQSAAGTTQLQVQGKSVDLTQIASIQIA